MEITEIAKFSLGTIVATPGAFNALEEAFESPLGLIMRHASGDWGDLRPEDYEENEESLKKGYRLFSSYKLRTGTKVWVITESDRSVTTILLPTEY
jgi:hypothetical protein